MSRLFVIVLFVLCCTNLPEPPPRAGAMLLIGAQLAYGQRPRRADVAAVAALGGCLFLNQLLYILGLRLAGVTLATCLQPSIPVITAALAMLLRIEHFSPMRASGAPLLSSSALLSATVAFGVHARLRCAAAFFCRLVECHCGASRRCAPPVRRCSLLPPRRVPLVLCRKVLLLTDRRVARPVPRVTTKTIVTGARPCRRDAGRRRCSPHGVRRVAGACGVAAD